MSGVNIVVLRGYVHQIQERPVDHPDVHLWEITLAVDTGGHTFYMTVVSANLYVPELNDDIVVLGMLSHTAPGVTEVLAHSVIPAIEGTQQAVANVMADAVRGVKV